MGADKPVKPEQSVLSVLQRSGLSALMQRADTLAQWDQTLRRNMPVALAGQCRLSRYDDDTLFFIASNPVWKNKLRLHSQEILDYANGLGLHARAIRIKVDPAFPAEPPQR